jgi:hypothetical protein
MHELHMQGKPEMERMHGLHMRETRTGFHAP